MPTIQSRKYPENEQFVTVETWKEMEEKGFARRFKVVDDGDMQDTVIATPLSFTDFSKPPEIDNSKLGREQIKAWLDEHEIEYSMRASTPKLYQIYLDNQ